jgi:hypothetical protein
LKGEKENENIEDRESVGAGVPAGLGGGHGFYRDQGDAL